MARKKKITDIVFDILNYSFMIFLVVSMIYPFWELIIVSISPPVEAVRIGLKIIPRGFTLEAYRQLLTSKILGYGYYNTILRTVIGTSISALLCFSMAYPLSKKSLPLRKTLTMFLVIPMFFSGGLVPNFLLINNLGIYDTIWALILPALISSYNVFVVRNFIISIPDSLEESAFIDGAGFFTILFKIILPLSKPVLATIALWVAVMHWNAWFDASIYTRSNNRIVLQLLLREYIIEKDNIQIVDSSVQSGGETVVTKTLQAAMVLMSIGPIVLVYPFLQKHFVKGVMIGAVKG
jgi:putative aldouronate transport system permease protein